LGERLKGGSIGLTQTLVDVLTWIFHANGRFIPLSLVAFGFLLKRINSKLLNRTFTGILVASFTVGFIYLFYGSMNTTFGYGSFHWTYILIFLILFKVGVSRCSLTVADSIIFAMCGLFFISDFWELPILFRQIFPSMYQRFDYTQPMDIVLPHFSRSAFNVLQYETLIFPFLALAKIGAKTSFKIRGFTLSLYLPTKKWCLIFAAYLAVGLILTFPIYNYFLPNPTRIPFLNIILHEAVFDGERLTVFTLLTLMILSSKGLLDIVASSSLTKPLVEYAWARKRMRPLSDYEKLVREELSSLKYNVVSVKAYFEDDASDKTTVVLSHDWDNFGHPQGFWEIEKNGDVRSTFYIRKKDLLKNLPFLLEIQKEGWEVGLHYDPKEDFDKDLGFFRANGIDVSSFSVHLASTICRSSTPQRSDVKADYFCNDNGGEICYGTSFDFTHKNGVKLDVKGVENFLRNRKEKTTVSLMFHVDWWSEDA
jgi:hypothetical protein